MGNLPGTRIYTSVHQSNTDLRSFCKPSRRLVELDEAKPCTSSSWASRCRRLLSCVSAARGPLLVPQRFPGLEGVSDALLGLSFSAKRHKRLPLQIQNILLAHRLRRGQCATRQNV